MTEVPENPTSAPESWVPDLTRFSFTELDKMPDAVLAEARAALLGKVDRPFATIAGSEGS